MRSAERDSKFGRGSSAGRLIAENANVLMDRAPAAARAAAQSAIEQLGGEFELGRLRLRGVGSRLQRGCGRKRGAGEKDVAPVYGREKALVIKFAAGATIGGPLAHKFLQGLFFG